jgi:hypothetical protein
VAVVFDYPAAGKDVPQLHDELVAAGLPPESVLTQGVVTDPGGPTAPPVVTPTVRLTYPDGQPQGPVDAVVAAHVPQARYDPATRVTEVDALRRESRRAALLAKTRAAATVADLKAVLLAHLREEEATAG